MGNRLYMHRCTVGGCHERTLRWWGKPGSTQICHRLSEHIRSINHTVSYSEFALAYYKRNEFSFPVANAVVQDMLIGSQESLFSQAFSGTNPRPPTGCIEQSTSPHYIYLMLSGNVIGYGRYAP